MEEHTTSKKSFAAYATMKQENLLLLAQKKEPSDGRVQTYTARFDSLTASRKRESTNANTSSAPPDFEGTQV